MENNAEITNLSMNGVEIGNNKKTNLVESGVIENIYSKLVDKVEESGRDKAWKMTMLGKFKEDLIKMNGFIREGDIAYGKNQVQADMIRAAEMMNTKLITDHGENSESNRLERLIANGKNTPSWLGCEVVQTASYDDFCRHTDAVLIYDYVENGQNKHFFLSADVTLSIKARQGENFSKLEKKLILNEDCIKSHRKNEVRYFDGEIGGDKYKGPLYCIPVVLGLDGDYMQSTRDEQWTKEHPAQFVLLEQILKQLTFYTDTLSSQINKDDRSENLRKQIEKAKEVIENVYSEKLKESVFHQSRIKSYTENDKVLGVISKRCKVEEKKNPN